MLAAIVSAAVFISPSTSPGLAAHSIQPCRRAAPLLQVNVDNKPPPVKTESADTAEASNPLPALPYAQLLTPRAAGDVAMILLFAAIGRGNHNSDGGSVLTTAAPFLLTWALIAPLLGAYKTPETRAAALLDPLPAVAVAVPLGCALRGVLQGYQPPLPFWIVALIATTVLVDGWRLAFFSLDNAFDQFANAIVGAWACASSARAFSTHPPLRTKDTRSGGSLTAHSLTLAPTVSLRLALTPTCVCLDAADDDD
jgi:hypothetical protein